MRYSPLMLLVFVKCSTFATSPATHSPLREQLAKVDTPTLEEAVRTCLAKGGWKVDPIGGLSGGANVVNAKNAEKAETQVFIQAPEVKPRLTGGPDYDDPFWKCLGGQLSGARTAPPASSEP
jgi:hypothetical protein